MNLIAGPNPGLGTWPARRARISPDRTAVLDPSRSLTYAELADRTARYAGALRRLGVGPGDRVAYLGVNAVEVFETFFATWLLGAIAVPLNYRLSGAELRYMLQDSGASVLVHSADANALVSAAAPLPDTLRHVLAVTPAGRPVDGPEFEAEIAEGPTLDDEPPVGLDDPAIVLYTSGTTGRPKGAVLTHGNLTWNTINYLAHVDVLSTDRALCIAPLFHCVGLGQVTLPTLFKGGSVELVPRADPGLVLERGRPELTGRGPVRRVTGAGTGRPRLAGPRSAAAAGLRHDRGISGGVHEHPRRHGGPPDGGGGAALLHRRRPAARRPPRAGRRRAGGAGGARTPRLRRLLEPTGGHRGRLRRRAVVPHRRRAERQRGRLGARRRPGQGRVHLGRGERVPRGGGGRGGPAGRGGQLRRGRTGRQSLG